MLGMPPHKKCATDSGAIDPALNPYNPNNWEEGTYEEDWLRYNPPPHHLVGPVLPAQPTQADELRLPD